MINNLISRIKNDIDNLIGNKIDENSPYEDSRNICNFCTIGSRKYLIKLIALYNSLLKSGCQFQLWVLSMDDFTYKVLSDLKLNHLNIISIKTLEEDNEILQEKEGKTENEYCWMLKAPLMEYVLLQQNIESIIYTDSDIYFLKDPSELFEYFKLYSIYLCPQRDMDIIEQKYGKYQAGLIGFKNDDEGIEALGYWKVKCLEWCRSEYDSVGQRFGDQKYLDEIPYRFHSVKNEDNYGVNAAPWNCVYNKERTVVIENGLPHVNKDEIILFHFACITIFNETEFDLWNLDRLEIPKHILSNLYIPYIIELIDAAQIILNVAYGMEDIIFSNKSSEEAKTYFAFDEFTVKIMEYVDFYHICSIVSNDYLLKIIALYRSMIRYQVNFNLWLCVIDKEAYGQLVGLELENTTVIHVDDITSVTREKHTTTEYCWMLKPVFVEYLFDEYKLNKVLYCDADMYFFSSLKYIYNEWGSYSFYMTTQRSDQYSELRDGQYQAGLLGFSNDNYARKILSWWKEKCLNWCFDWHDERLERWGDQKYLDKVPIIFENIKISHNLGINAGPWNLILNDQSYDISEDNQQVCINNYKVCCYHFGSMKIIGLNKFDLWYHCEVEIRPEIIDSLYYPYMKTLKQIMGEISVANIDISHYVSAENEISSKNLYIFKEAV